MTLQEVMSALESMGTAQNRKVYARHGYGENMFGVSFANLGKLAKKIKKDHGLAAGLWKTGNGDARMLATMIADPGQATEKELDGWMEDIGFYALAHMFARNVAARTRFAQKKAEAWSKSKEDFTGQAGWDLVGMLAMEDGGLPDAFFEKQLETIEQRIHQSKNRTRHAMNNALIAIGIRNARLEKLALGAAARIGKVEVDHGETNCKTPDAAAYIKKTLAHRRKKGR